MSGLGRDSELELIGGEGMTGHVNGERETREVLRTQVDECPGAVPEHRVPGLNRSTILCIMLGSTGVLQSTEVVKWTFLELRSNWGGIDST